MFRKLFFCFVVIGVVVCLTLQFVLGLFLIENRFLFEGFGVFIFLPFNVFVLGFYIKHFYSQQTKAKP